MKANYYLYTFLLVFLITACSKDKFETAPTLEIVEYNTKFLQPIPSSGESFLRIVLKYTDKEGDINEGELFVTRIRTNQRPLPPDSKPDTIAMSFPIQKDIIQDNRPSGELLFRISHNDLKYNQIENDSLKFHIWFLDAAKNSSDTLESDIIIVERD